MQIRELDLKELESAWAVVGQLRTQLTYNEFEDLIYDMRDSNYTMFGIFERGELFTYAGVVISTNLYHKRHLFIHELVTDEKHRSKGYGKMMLDYLCDYAKVGACQNIVLSSGTGRVEAHSFYKSNEFEKKSFVFVKAL
ncbi:GNAT family N-acetyltransferase [Sulfurimonas sp.]